MNLVFIECPGFKGNQPLEEGDGECGVGGVEAEEPVERLGTRRVRGIRVRTYETDSNQARIMTTMNTMKTPEGSRGYPHNSGAFLVRACTRGSRKRCSTDACGGDGVITI